MCKTLFVASGHQAGPVIMFISRGLLHPITDETSLWDQLQASSFEAYKCDSTPSLT